MSSSSPRDEFVNFAAPLQRALSLVVPAGRGVLTAYPGPPRQNADLWLALPQKRPVRLTGRSLSINVRVGFRIVVTESAFDRFRVLTTSYSYTLLDRNHRELLAYHFHPDGAGWCTYPHLHVGTASGIIDNKAHLVSGPVTLPAFIRMLIEDPAIPVVSLRPDWPRLLGMDEDLDAEG